MKRIRTCTALAVVIVMILTLFAGCGNMFESPDFRAYQRFADQVADGKEFEKEDVVAKLGAPRYFQDKTEGAEYMEATVGWWRYEEFDATGYPWALSITFDRNGQVTSVEFAPGVGG